LHPTSTLHGTACTLRPVTDEDVATLARILAEPDVSRWWPRYDEERVRNELIEGPDTSVFAVEHDGEVVGAILYVEEPSPDYRHASIDVFLHPNWHGKGLGTDAVRTLARHLIHDRGHHRLAIDPAASQREGDPHVQARRLQAGRRHAVLRARPRRQWHDGLLMDLLEVRPHVSRPPRCSGADRCTSCPHASCCVRPTSRDLTAFYEEGLGLARYREWGGPGHRGVVLFLGGGFLELTESGDGPAPQGVRLWLQVADADAARDELAGRG
jgi:aminoglycoside 6'-N-acetyltransferase